MGIMRFITKVKEGFKLKKMVVMALALVMVLTVAACGSKKTDSEVVSGPITYETPDVEDAETPSEDSEEETTSNTGWKEVLNEYEAWVDKYIEITKKYKANPSDMSILSDYTDMMAELTEWSTKIEEMEKELEEASPAELAEYSVELARIASKLAQAAY